MVTKIRIAIDPGVGGAVAWSYEVAKGQWTDHVWGFPKFLNELTPLVREIIAPRGAATEVMCFIEEAHAMPTSEKMKGSDHNQALRDLKKITTADRNQVQALQYAIGGLKEAHTVKRGATATWTFAENYGRWKQVLLDHHIPFVIYPPKEWMKLMGVRSGMGKNERKDYLWEVAKQRFPNLSVRKYAADAVCLLYLCKRMEGVKADWTNIVKGDVWIFTNTKTTVNGKLFRYGNNEELPQQDG